MYVQKTLRMIDSKCDRDCSIFDNYHFERFTDERLFYLQVVCFTIIVCNVMITTHGYLQLIVSLYTLMFEFNFRGLVLQDLTFVHIGNSETFSDGNINFAKRWQQFHILGNIKRFKKW